MISHSADVVNGEAWEAFVAVGPNDDPPVVRQLDNSDGRYAWPESELTNGIAGIEIRLYGDDSDGAYARAVGTSKAGVVMVLARVANLVDDRVLRDLFGNAPTEEERQALQGLIDQIAAESGDVDPAGLTPEQRAADQAFLEEVKAIFDQADP